MKIQEVCNKTGLSKRNIHFYIKEKLISPSMNKENGYYNFDDEDCRRLMIVREFRNAGLSISVIRSILNTPTATSYYLRLHANQLKKEIAQQEQIITSINNILGQLPINPNLDAILDVSRKADIPEPLSAGSLKTYESGDNHIVNQFLWRGFLPENQLTEYQQYLWDKINRITNVSSNENYRKIRQFLSSLNQKQIEYVFTSRHQHERYIASLDQEGCINYVENMKENIDKNLEDDCWIKTWKYYYESYFHPISDIYDSNIQELVAEIIPWFASYLHNIHMICERLFDWLHTDEGLPLLSKLNKELDGFLDLEHCHHCQLEAMCAVPIIEIFF